MKEQKDASNQQWNTPWTSKCSTIYKRKHFEVEDITAEMVQESFIRTKESAGPLDGWSPKELSLLSFKAYGHIAVLLDHIGSDGRASHELQTLDNHLATLPMLGHHDA